MPQQQDSITVPICIRDDESDSRTSEEKVITHYRQNFIKYSLKG